MKITQKVRVTNLENKYKEIMNQLTSMVNPNEGVNLIIARERLQGAIKRDRMFLEKQTEKNEEKDDSIT